MADTESDGGGSSTESSSVNGEVEHRRRIEKRLSEFLLINCWAYQVLLGPGGNFNRF
ncbi:hypothetical protein ANCCAN_22355 [Ancylostoma caninum]|uniref:Uncharacterized protein n=1 Tax=Ancylostoma caninum TaxID=29170 RepID=A0A368FI77_ANCCA|nr:hypothetical protein ANCCAN_22355 [Ancylostoma caninum]